MELLWIPFICLYAWAIDYFGRFPETTEVQ